MERGAATEMLRSKAHPFHLVTPSPWPLLISVSACTLAIGATLYMHAYEGGLSTLLLGLGGTVLILVLWWRDVIREGTFEGMHTLKVQQGLRLGFVLFIVSEVMFFLDSSGPFFILAYLPLYKLVASGHQQPLPPSILREYR